ncbi:MAG: IPT/TIG domain-containing protein, partial [Arenicella sp.]|nr:IPT/TIG domain-containing protein [Arenicella sp.]
MGIELPNYPPQQLGAAVVRDNILFAGVKLGADPSDENRFLMRSGMEIYDIGIWENPIRVAQMRTDKGVTGIAPIDNVAYLANGADGLAVVNITNLANPLMIKNYPVPGHSATDVDFNSQLQTLALSVADHLGSGFVRFYDLSDDFLSPPQGFNTIVFNDGDLLGQPVDIQWLGSELYVLLKRETDLYLAIFDDLPSQTHRVQKVDRGVASSITNASMHVQFGQVAITTDNEMLVLQDNQQGSYETIYWTAIQIPGAELFANVGGSFVATQGGVIDTPSPALVISEIRPTSGSTISKNESIRIRFNDLINTDETIVSSAIVLKDADGAIIPSSHFQIEATNTLVGALIEIRFTEQNNYYGDLTLNVGTEIRALNGTNLLQAVTVNYSLSNGNRPSIDQISRLVDGQASQHFFHADGLELAILSGRDFGAIAGDIKIWIGETEISSDAINSVQDDEIEFTVPNLFLPNDVLTLPITVQRGELKVIKHGAVVILPTVKIADISPTRGPPQGGNSVSLYGSGFSHSTVVKFAQVTAGGMEVVNSGHIRVTAPSGSFGFAHVTAENTQFINENAISPIDYFYSANPSGYVDLEADKPSPISSIHLGDQIVYAVTGGRYKVIGRESGRVEKTLSSNVARLIVADVSDPVRPQIIEKEFSTELLSYHIDVTGGLSPKGFVALVGNGVNLYAIGASSLYHFDTTLPAAPVLLNTIQLEGSARDIVVDNDLLYLSDSRGVHIYQLTQQRQIRKLRTISSTELRGTTDKLSLNGDRLWATMPNSRRIVEIELMSGNYEVVRDIPATALNGSRFKPRDILNSGNLLFIATGSLGSVELFVLDDNSATAVASLNLAYLVRNGDIYAGQLELKGQTLYVASGQGDLQLFDVSAWLEGQYNINVDLLNYFSVLGDAQTFAFHPQAIYVGSAFPYQDGEATENPLESPQSATHLGGRLNTVVNDMLTIIEQIPQPEQVISVDDEIELQFNRHLNFAQVRDNGDQLLVVTLNGAKVEGYVSLKTNSYGSRLIFRPSLPWLDDTRYRVTLSAAIQDNTGVGLAHRHSFRFITEDNTAPTIEQIRPAFASWRGGEIMTIVGENLSFDSTIQLGGVVVSPTEYTSVTENKLSFRLPALENSPADNLVMGIEVHNGNLKASKRAAFTYIADAQITDIGSYDPLEDVFDPQSNSFKFGGHNTVAISGVGFSELTRIYINGVLAENVVLIGPNLISFTLPGNMLGDITISISNSDDPNDRAINGQLKIELVASLQRSAVKALHRHNSLLVLIDNNSVAGQDAWRLTTTAEVELPQTLSSGLVRGNVIDIAVNDQYMVFLTENVTRQIHVFDITNIYAPELVNSFNNPASEPIDAITLSGNVLLGSGAEKLYSTYVLGDNIEVHSFSEPVLDIAYDQDGAYILFDTRVDFYAIPGLNSVSHSYTHTVTAATELVVDAQRLAIRSNAEIEILDTFTLKYASTEPLIGKAFINHQSADFNGELLALRLNTSDSIVRFYDMNKVGQELELASLVDITTTNNDVIIQRAFSANLYEWIENSNYLNVVLPFNNVWQVKPNEINSQAEIISLSITGADNNWRKAVIDVIPDSQSQALPGFNRSLGDQLLFEVLGANYELGESYEISLAVNPEQSIIGAEVEIDLPWHLKTTALFESSNPSLSAISPSNSITDRLVDYQVIGQQLQAISDVSLGEISTLDGDFDTNTMGTLLQFEASLSTPGYKTLQLDQGSLSNVATLPAAVLISQAIDVSAIATNNAMGDHLLSDSGGNKITIAGLGLNGDLRVHLILFDSGVSISTQNQLAYRFDNGRIIINNSPKVIPGKQYQLVIVREQTSEQIELLGSHLLDAIDDTRPKIAKIAHKEAITYFDNSKPLTLSFNEAVSGTGFSIIKQFKDYSDSDDLDISDRFELVNIADSTLVLRLKQGEVIDD